MRLVWRPEARDDLKALIGHIARRSPTAASRMLDLIEDFAERLPAYPLAFRRGRVEDTREAVVHPNYIIVYRVHSDRVTILSVLHSRQRYP